MAEYFRVTIVVRADVSEGEEKRAQGTFCWGALQQGSPTFLKLRATLVCRLMRRATSLMHVSELKMLLNLSLVISV